MFRATVAAALLLAGAAYGAERAPAELVAFQGKAEVRTTPDGGWQHATVKLPLPALSTVRTGTASWASLLFIDQTQIKLSANALFQVKAVSRDQHRPTIVEMLKGKAWTQSKTPPKRFIMKTPAVNAGIQGTDWVVEVAEDGTTTINTSACRTAAFISDVTSANLAKPCGPPSALSRSIPLRALIPSMCCGVRLYRATSNPIKAR